MESSACADCVWRCEYLYLTLCPIKDPFALLYRRLAEYNVRVRCNRWLYCTVQRGRQSNISDEHLQGRDWTIISIKDQRIAHRVEGKLEDKAPIHVLEARELRLLDRTILQPITESTTQQSTLKFFSHYLLLRVRVQYSTVL